MHCCSIMALQAAEGLWMPQSSSHHKGAYTRACLVLLACRHQDVQHFLTWHLSSASRQLPAALHRLRQCGSLRWVEAACIAPTHGACLASPRQRPNTRWYGMFLRCTGGYLDMLIHGRRLPGLSFT